MNKKKNVKGFTLIELIIVMAIFSIIMLGTMSIINPVNKIVKKASLQEANSAAVDNMKRYFESSLRYADAIDVHVGGLSYYDYDHLVDDPITGSKKPNHVILAGSGAEDEAVKRFITTHYNNRTNPGTEDPLSGNVYMLKVDNGNGGRVTEYQYKFTAGYRYYIWDNGSKETELDANGNTVDKMGTEECAISLVKKDDSVINPVYYENYNFYFIPGYNKQDNISDTSVIDAAVDASGSTVFNTSKDKVEDYYAKASPVDPSKSPYAFNKDLFSMSVMTYKNKNSVGNSAPAAAGQPTNYAGLVFKAPFALSNINISLVNINSSFSSDKASDMYGPIRWSGKASDGATYNPTKMVDVATPTNGKWDYEEINAREASLFNQRYNGFEPVEGDCIYFIFTLPDMK